MNNNHDNKSYRLLPYIAMIYVSIKILTILMFYKVVQIFSITASASTLIIPLWFLIGDVITEVYGYKISRSLVYMSAICQLLFACLAYAFNSFDSVQVISANQNSYTEVVSHLPKIATTSVLSIIVGGLLNAFILNKLKIRVHGKHFILRSLGSSTIGEMAFTVCAYMTGFFGVTSYLIIVKLMVVSYVVKVLLNPLLVFPIAALADIVKKFEHDDNHRITSKQCSQKNQVTKTDPNKFKITKLTNNDDGDSIFVQEYIDLPMAHALGSYSNLLPTQGMMFRASNVPVLMDKHNAPNKQYIIYLSGKIEVTTSTGDKCVFQAGDVLLAEDLQGNGHVTRIIEIGRAVVVVA